VKYYTYVEFNTKNIRICLCNISAWQLLNWCKGHVDFFKKYKILIFCHCIFFRWVLTILSILN